MTGFLLRGPDSATPLPGADPAVDAPAGPVLPVASPPPPLPTTPAGAVPGLVPSATPPAARRVPDGRTRARREALERELEDLLLLQAAGRATADEVDHATLGLLDARHDADEIDDATWHRERIVVLTHVAEGTEQLSAAGMVSEMEGRRARLAVERERRLAGEPSQYESKREAYLRDLAEQGARRVEVGFTSAKAVREEREAAEKEFPP